MGVYEDGRYDVDISKNVWHMEIRSTTYVYSFLENEFLTGRLGCVPSVASGKAERGTRSHRGEEKKKCVI